MPLSQTSLVDGGNATFREWVGGGGLELEGFTAEQQGRARIGDST